MIIHHSLSYIPRNRICNMNKCAQIDGRCVECPLEVFAFYYIQYYSIPSNVTRNLFMIQSI